MKDPQSLEAWVVMLSLTACPRAGVGLALAVVLAVVLIGCQVPLR